MKILVATEKPFAAIAVEGIKKAASEAGADIVMLEKYTDKNQLLTAVRDVDALIVRSDIVDKAVFDAARSLKIVVRAGAGYDNIDLAAATAAGVCVMNTPGQNANAVAELVIGMLIYAFRNRFNGTSGKELKGKTLGLHAFGNVGRNVARIAKGLGMNVVAYDAFCPKEVIEKEGVKAVDSVEELFSGSDIVSLHIPATEQTRGSINHSLMDIMPKGATLVNTARKEVINEHDLIEWLTARADVQYLADIQPLCHEQLLQLCPDRYFATPKKMGAQTAEANINAGIAAARQIIDYLKNGNERFRLN